LLQDEQNRTSQAAKPAKQVVAALITRGNKMLICQRTKDQPMPLKWEFPGGKIEPGEAERDALRRELDEELGIRATIAEKVTTIEHRYKNGGAVELHFYRVRKYEGEIENRIFAQVRWTDRRNLPRFDFLEADRDLVRQLSRGKLLRN
jgi:8-oxo-dGTP diphosphatase